jgi:cytochrome c553
MWREEWLDQTNLRADEDCERAGTDGSHGRVFHIVLSTNVARLITMKKLAIIAAALLLAGGVSLQAADVKENYEKNCTKCHGPDGKGDTKMGKKSGVKDMTDAKVQAEMKDDKAFKSVKEGLKDGDKTLMKPAEGLSDDEIKALIAHCRTFKK